MKTKLINKNVTINGRRTSLRLEQASWEAMNDICQCEGLTLHELCSLIETHRQGASRTLAVRAFIITYFRTVVAEYGALQRGTTSVLLPELGAHR